MLLYCHVFISSHKMKYKIKFSCHTCALFEMNVFREFLRAIFPTRYNIICKIIFVIKVSAFSFIYVNFGQYFQLKATPSIWRETPLWMVNNKSYTLPIHLFQRGWFIRSQYRQSTRMPLICK